MSNRIESPYLPDRLKALFRKEFDVPEDEPPKATTNQAKQVDLETTREDLIAQLDQELRRHPLLDPKVVEELEQPL